MVIVVLAATKSHKSLFIIISPRHRWCRSCRRLLISAKVCIESTWVVLQALWPVTPALDGSEPERRALHGAALISANQRSDDVRLAYLSDRVKVEVRVKVTNWTTQSTERLITASLFNSDTLCL